MYRLIAKSMTIKELKAEFNGKYIDIEVYNPLSRGIHYPDHFHTDNCSYIEDYWYAGEGCVLVCMLA